jgi:glutamyl-tRNA synthetase
MNVRVRYAPSPTGSPHVGNIRDALFKHLLAKHYGGIHLLRIEDTDRTRLVEGVEDEIIESLHWMKIEWQEGFGVGGPHEPYRQSERKERGIYAELIQELIAKGHAYYAFDTSEELDQMREFQTLNKQPTGYFGGIWRDAEPAVVQEKLSAGVPSVIRQKIPRGTTIEIHDVIRGRIEWDSDTVDDPVLIKGDGMPTYHFAAMVDDHLMGITHIMRGEEWISSAPKHAALFDAFGWERPVFVHCPVIKGKDGKKLSKRHGDTRVLDFRSAGYIPEALCNFIALIGWSPGGDLELMDSESLIQHFTLDGLQPSPGVFDIDKLNWMNGNYMRGLSLDELFESVRAFIKHPETKEYWTREGNVETGKWAALELLGNAMESDPDYARAVLPLEQERVDTFADFGLVCDFFFLDEVIFDEKSVEKAILKNEHAKELYQFLNDRLASVASITSEECEILVKEYAALRGIEKMGTLIQPIRCALTGKLSGPGLFDLMSVLGPTRMKARFARTSKLGS